jgi:hypothetical protein
MLPAKSDVDQENQEKVTNKGNVHILAIYLCYSEISVTSQPSQLSQHQFQTFLLPPPSAPTSLY